MSSVRLGAAATAFLHKLQNGIPPWVPLKGFEKKTYKQLQEEALESKRRDLAVLEANDGIWPGVMIPSHALFLWASGSEMTTLLEQDHMPNKYIPKHLRYVHAAGFFAYFPFLLDPTDIIRFILCQIIDEATGQWYTILSSRK